MATRKNKIRSRKSTNYRRKRFSAKRQYKKSRKVYRGGNGPDPDPDRDRDREKKIIESRNRIEKFNTEFDYAAKYGKEGEAEKIFEKYKKDEKERNAKILHEQIQTEYEKFEKQQKEDEIRRKIQEEETAYINDVGNTRQIVKEINTNNYIINWSTSWHSDVLSSQRNMEITGNKRTILYSLDWDAVSKILTISNFNYSRRNGFDRLWYDSNLQSIKGFNEAFDTVLFFFGDSTERVFAEPSIKKVITETIQKVKNLDRIVVKLDTLDPVVTLDHVDTITNVLYKSQKEGIKPEPPETIRRECNWNAIKEWIKNLNDKKLLEYEQIQDQNLQLI
jgi:hypothetical protein